MIINKKNIQKKIVILFVLSLLGLSPRFGQAVETLMLDRFVDLGGKMEKEEVFIKASFSFDISQGYLYIADYDAGTIHKVDMETGKQVAVFSRKGQGPGELAAPRYLRVKNNLIYVYDKGSRAIKIFSINGTFQLQFTVDNSPSNFSLSKNNEILVAEYDPVKNSYIGVYNQQGKKLRKDLLHVKPSAINDIQTTRLNGLYSIQTDQEGNIYLLFNYFQELYKFNEDGKILWKAPVQNELIDSFKKQMPSSKPGSLRTYIKDFEITDKENIIIAHAGGGSIFDSSGKLKFLVKIAPDQTTKDNIVLDYFRCHHHELITASGVYPYYRIYKLKEGI